MQHENAASKLFADVNLFDALMNLSVWVFSEDFLS